MNELLESIINKNIDKVKEIIENNNYTWRIVYKDGKNFIITCDYNLKRINLYLEKDIVIKTTIG